MIIITYGSFDTFDARHYDMDFFRLFSLIICQFQVLSPSIDSVVAALWFLTL